MNLSIVTVTPQLSEAANMVVWHGGGSIYLVWHKVQITSWNNAQDNLLQNYMTYDTFSELFIFMILTTCLA